MRSSRIPLFAALVSCGALAATTADAASGGHTYQGKSSEHGTVFFTAKGHKIHGFSTPVGYNGHCGSGGGPGYLVLAPSIRIKANHTFSKTVTAGGLPGSHGVTPLKFRISGKLSGTKARGSVIAPSTRCAGKHGSGPKNFGYSVTFKVTRK